MTRSSLTVVGVLLLVFALGVGVWKVMTWPATDGASAGSEPVAEDERPRRSKWFWQSDDEPVHRDEPPAPPRARSIRITNVPGEPIVGAKVKLLRSPLLQGDRAGEHSLLNCDDLQHLTQTAARLREGKLSPEVLAEATTDAEGRATFPERSWPSSTVMVIDTPGRPPFTSVELFDREELVIADEDPTNVESLAHLSDASGNPISSARVTIVDLASGQVTTERPGSDGQVRLKGSPSRWAIFEADGYFPVSTNLESASAEFPVILLKPGTVEVTAPPALGAFSVKLVKQHEREVRLRDGRALYENERPGYISVQVTEPGFLGSGEGSLDDGGRLTVALQVKRAGRLLVTVVDQQGNPVPEVTAQLSSPSATVSASASEEGQRLELGPIGEGPAVLQVSAPRFKTRAQSLELKPGDTDLEVVLAEAPSLRGRVVDAQGQPVAEATVQVQSDLPNDPGGAVTGPDGTFTLHVDDEGAWRVEAMGLEGEVARTTAQVPGPDVVLRLEPLGSATVTVYAPDGRPAEGARVMLASAESPEPDIAESQADGVLTFDQLVPGEYRVEIDDAMNGESFLRWQGELVVHSAQEARLTVRLRASGKVEGVVVDPEGEPLSYSMIGVKGDGSRLVETGDDGAFELLGLEPGATVELVLERDEFIGLTPSTLKVGGPRVTLKAIRGDPVRGRVVDVQGAPVRGFSVNGVDIDSEDGRFEAAADARGLLLVASFEGLATEVKVEGRKDVGDVVLKPTAPFSGDVYDEARQPVVGARVLSADFVLGEVLTDARGHFEADLITIESPTIALEARFGDLATVAEVPGSARTAELILLPATRVSGVVRGSGGRPLVTSVIARGGSDEEVRVDTDDQGRFSFALSPGHWFFGTRASRASVAVLVNGREQRVDLGVPDDSCEVAVRGVPLPGSVFLVPASSSWIPDEMVLYESSGVPQGTVSLGLDGPAFVGRGVPCGAYQVHALYGSETVSSAVSLSRGQPGQVTVRAPSLAGIGETIGMRHHEPIRIDFEEKLEPPNAEVIE